MITQGILSESCEWCDIFFLGSFDLEGHNGKIICKYHRESLGIYWRGQKRTCQVPPEIAQHDEKRQAERNRAVQVRFSRYIISNTGLLVPVGSGKEHFRSSLDRFV